MTRILWSEGLETGVLRLDNFHRSFVDLINQLEEEIVSKSSSKVIKGIIADLYDLSRSCFLVEEDLMRECAFEDINRRLEYHQHFLAELEFFLSSKLNIPHEDNYFECYDFIYNWFFTHVLEEDAKLVRHLDHYQLMRAA